jgi:hypothetical protein
LCGAVAAAAAGAIARRLWRLCATPRGRRRHRCRSGIRSRQGEVRNVALGCAGTSIRRTSCQGRRPQRLLTRARPNGTLPTLRPSDLCAVTGAADDSRTRPTALKGAVPDVLPGHVLGRPLGLRRAARRSLTSSYVDVTVSGKRPGEVCTLCRVVPVVGGSEWIPAVVLMAYTGSDRSGRGGLSG